MTTTIHILGTGTPTRRGTRHGSAFAVQVGDETLMVDCDPGTSGKLVKAGLWPTDVDTLFLAAATTTLTTTSTSTAAASRPGNGRTCAPPMAP